MFGAKLVLNELKFLRHIHINIFQLKINACPFLELLELHFPNVLSLQPERRPNPFSIKTNPSWHVLAAFRTPENPKTTLCPPTNARSMPKIPLKLLHSFHRQKFLLRVLTQLNMKVFSPPACSCFRQATCPSRPTDRAGPQTP